MFPVSFPRFEHTFAPFVAFAALALSACGANSNGDIVARGTVEVVETDLAPMVAARVVALRVDEGNVVEAGDTVAVLTQASLPATLDGYRARVAAAEAALRDLERGARLAEIRALEAELQGAEADAERSARDLERGRPLAADGAIAQQQFDALQSAATEARSRRDAVAERLQLMREGSRPDQIRQARAELSSARAALAAAEADAGDLVLVAPARGVILAKLAEPGEMLRAGTPVLTHGATDRPWVRAYLSAAALSRVALGATARVTLDGGDGREYRGTLTAINPRSEFTPRAALTEQERADLMFGVKIEVHDTTGRVKAGLPATVYLTPAS